jgi:hypothetical protein
MQPCQCLDEQVYKQRGMWLSFHKMVMVNNKQTWRLQFELCQDKNYISTASRPALEPTQPHIQWILEAISPGGEGSKAAGA